MFFQIKISNKKVRFRETKIAQQRSQSGSKPFEKQPSNKGKKQKTVAPVTGQGSLDFFIKRKEKLGIMSSEKPADN